jgi:Ser-tRNA(Ala) deacylase AlaX
MANKPNYTLDRRLLDKIIAQQKSGASTQQYAPVGDTAAASNKAYKTTAFDDNSGPSVFSRALDLISRPLYAVQNVIKDSFDPDPLTNNPLESAWAGFSGIDKTTGSDVIAKYDEQNPDVEVPDWIKGWGGFLTDVAFDPLTWTTFGIGGLVKKGATAANKALSGSEKAAARLRAGEGGLTEFTDKEIANLGGTVENLPGAAAKMSEKEAKEAAEKAAKDAETPVPEQVVVAETNAARNADAAEAAVEEAKVNPASTVEELNKPRIPKPEDLGVGTPWKPGSPPVANDYAQAKTIADITRKASTDASRASLSAGEREFFMHKQLTDKLAAAKETDFARGIYPVIPHQGENYFLHANDVFDALGDSVKRVQLNKYDKIPPSSILQGAAAVLHGRTAGLSGDELLASVKEAVIKGHKTKTPISATKAERAAKHLIKSGDNLEAHLLANTERIAKRDLTTGHTLGTKVGSDTVRVVNNPEASVADSLGAAADLKGAVVREGRQQGLSPGGMAVGARAADDAVAGTLKATDEAGARATLGAAKDTAKGKHENIQGRQSSQARKDAKELDEEVAKAEEKAVYVNLGEKMDANMDKGIHRLYAGTIGGMTHGFRMGNLNDIYRTEQGMQESLQKAYTEGLGVLQKKYGKEQFDATVNYIVASGGKFPKNMDPLLAESIREIKPMMDHVFDPSDLVGNTLLRMGLDIDTFNHLTDAKGLKKFNLSKTKSGKVEQSSLDEMRMWKVDDWADFLSRMQSAALEGATRKAVGNDFARQFGHDVYQPGMVKLAKVDYDKAPMSHFTDNSKWYWQDDVDKMRRFNNEVDKLIGYTGSNKAVESFVKNLDRYARLWKPANTIFRWGHHVKTFIGDGMMNYVFGVKNPRHYENALGAMRSASQFKGDIKELSKMYDSRQLVDSAKGAKKAFTMTLKDGTKIDISQAQLYQLGMRTGALPTFRMAEDILAPKEGKENIVDRATNRLMDTKVAKGAGWLSENSNHLHSLAQMSHMLADPKFTSKYDNLDDAARAASIEVLKWHPNAAGLTKTEMKYHRRGIPFYTWFRQAVPKLLMATLDHPGRITSYPKATYAFQQSIGMEPESYSEPFSSRESLPSFMKGMVSGNVQIGDSNFGYNLGSPAETLAGIFSGGSQPAGDDGEVPSWGTSLIKATGSNLAGMINPALTLPFELAQGAKITGKHISDPSEGIDQAIPFASTIGGISGYSPSGTIGNLFNTDPNTPILDPQRAVALGEKANWLNTSTINWLTGLGITNANNQRYTNIALRENR